MHACFKRALRMAGSLAVTANQAICTRITVGSRQHFAPACFVLRNKPDVIYWVLYSGSTFDLNNGCRQPVG